MANLYPEEPLLVANLEQRKEMISYPAQLESEMIDEVSGLLDSYLPHTKIFPNLPA